MIETDLFDVTVSNNGGALSLYTSGFGSPPLQDGNSLPSHGIFDTYFEIYQFQFDGAVMTIGNSEPGEGGSGDGYAEEFNVQINALADEVTGLHVDLFVTEGDGVFDAGAAEDSNKSLVVAFAPFSHDAQVNPKPNVPNIPEPSAVILAGLSSLTLCTNRRRN